MRKSGPALAGSVNVRSFSSAPAATERINQPANTAGTERRNMASVSGSLGLIPNAVVGPSLPGLRAEGNRRKGARIFVGVEPLARPARCVGARGAATQARHGAVNG